MSTNTVRAQRGPQSFRDLARQHRLMAEAEPLPRVRALLVGSADKCDFLAGIERVTAATLAVSARAEAGQIHELIGDGELTVDLCSKAVAVRGKRIHLTPLEYAVLELLVSRNPAIVAKETMRKHVYGGWNKGERRTIDVFICNLRKKLRNASGGANYICTIPGQGYMLDLRANKGLSSGGLPPRRL